MLLFWIYPICKRFHPIYVTILSCQNGCPAWNADGIGDKTIRQPGTFLGKAINIGSREMWGKPGSITPPGLGSVIIRHHKKDIRTIIRCMAKTARHA
jgi:hypothetical protein